MTKIAVILLVAVLGDPSPSSASQNEEVYLHLLANEQLIVGVIPAAGGRTVLIRPRDGKNLLHARPDEWEEMSRRDGLPAIPGEWTQDVGQVVWLGPQSAFWSDQTMSPRKAERQDNWPPDPIITEAPYTVLTHEPDRIVMRSPPSPVWQVELTKTLVALPDGRVRFEASARNVGDQSVRKNLWFNFRAPPEARDYVWVGNKEKVRLETDAVLEVHVDDGYFSLMMEPPQGGDRSAKAFLTTDTNRIVMETAQGVLLIHFEATPVDQVPPGHAPVEIFRHTSPGGPELLELEHHGPWTELQPGESMTRVEYWEFLPGLSKKELVPETLKRTPTDWPEGRR